MIKIHNNIIIGTPSDLQQLINYTTFIINCSPHLANLLNHPNFININITNPNLQEILYLLNQTSEFIYNKISSNQNIFIMCDTGINNSLIVGMFFLMKLHNINYYSVYYNIASSHKIHSFDFYLGLTHFEPHILKKIEENRMDLS